MNTFCFFFWQSTFEDDQLPKWPIEHLHSMVTTQPSVLHLQTSHLLLQDSILHFFSNDCNNKLMSTIAFLCLTWSVYNFSCLPELFTSSNLCFNLFFNLSVHSFLVSGPCWKKFLFGTHPYLPHFALHILMHLKFHQDPEIFKKENFYIMLQALSKTIFMFSIWHLHLCVNIHLIIIGTIKIITIINKFLIIK